MGTIIIGIFFLITGGIVIARRKNSIDAAAVTIAGIIAAALGALLIWGGIWGLNRMGKVLMIWLIGGSVAIMALYSGCRHLYIKIFCCRQETMGTFQGIKKHSGFYRNRYAYTLEFQYRADGKWYRKESEDMYINRGRLEKKYENGQEYPIFISTKNPGIFAVKRRPFFEDIMMLFTGFLFLGCTIWVNALVLK